MDAVAEPVRNGPGVFADLGKDFGFVGEPLVRTIAQGNHKAELFPGIQKVVSPDFFVGKPHPAGVQPELLGQKHQAFSVIAALLRKAGRFVANQRNIIFYTGKFSIVREETFKCLWAVCDQLDMQSALLVAFVDFLLQGFLCFFLYGAVPVGPDGVPPLYCFCKCHNCASWYPEFF